MPWVISRDGVRSTTQEAVKDQMLHSNDSRSGLRHEKSIGLRAACSSHNAWARAIDDGSKKDSIIKQI